MLENQSMQSYYEGELIKLSTQNNELRQQNLSMKVQFQQICKQLNQNQIVLIEKQQRIREQQKCNRKNTIYNLNLKHSLEKRQYQYKQLYNYVFVDDEFQGQLEKEQTLVGKNCIKYKLKEHNTEMQLLNAINKVANDHYQQKIFTLRNTLIQRNQIVKEVLEENQKLKASLFDCTTHYQLQNTKLKQEIMTLQYKYNAKDHINQGPTKSILKLENLNNKALEEQLNLANQQLSYFKQLSYLSQNTDKNKQKQKMVKTSINSVEEVVEIIQQNERLKQQNEELNEQIINLCQQFPDLFQNRQKINKFLNEYKKQEGLKDRLKEYENKIYQLQDQISSLKILLDQLQNNQVKLFCFNQRKYQQIIRLVIKLKATLSIIDPYFSNLYRFNSAGLLDEDDLNLIQADFASQVQTLQNLYQKIANLTLEINQLQATILTKDKLFKQKQTKQQQQNKIIQDLKIIINSGILETVKEQKPDVNFSISLYQSCIKELQQQRQQLCQIIRRMEIQSQSLKAQRDYYRDNRQIHNIIVQQKEIHPFKSLTVEVQSFQFNTQILFQKINEVRNQITNMLSLNKNQFTIIVKEYQNKIKKMQQKLTKIIMEQQVSKSQIADKHLEQQLQEKQINQKQKAHQMQIGQIQLQDFRFGQQSQIPINNISQQSVNYMTELLNSHQAMLRNVIVQYERLKMKYQQGLKEIKKYSVIVQEANELKRKDIELKGCLVRINEADKNINRLEMQVQRLEEKCLSIKEESKNKLEQLSQENQNLKKRQQQLKQRLENVKSQLLESISAQSMSNQSNPHLKDNSVMSLLTVLKSKKDQIVFLKQIIAQKDQSIAKMRDQITKFKIIHQENNIKQSNQIEQSQIIELKQIIKQGKLTQVIEQSINLLTKISNSQQTEKKSMEIE